MAILHIENINEESIKNYELISLAEQCVIKHCQPPVSIAGKGKIIGDLIEPCVDIEDIESQHFTRKVYAHRIAVDNIELPTRENLHER